MSLIFFIIKNEICNFVMKTKFRSHEFHSKRKKNDKLKRATKIIIIYDCDKAIHGDIFCINALFD